MVQVSKQQEVTPNPGNVVVKGDLIAQLEAANARIAERDAQIAALKASSAGKLTPKVSKRGAVSVYGLGRFPVTLYATQWSRLAESMPLIAQFITARASDLSTGKDDVRFANVTDTPNA